MTFQGQRVIEVFTVLKEPHQTLPYVPYAYYYDPKKRDILYKRSYKPENGMLLHGLYQRKIKNKL